MPEVPPHQEVWDDPVDQMVTMVVGDNPALTLEAIMEVILEVILEILMETLER